MGHRADLFDEVTYLASNPDVAKAVREGVFRNGFDHWMKHGKREGRPARFRTDFEELDYLALNPDVEGDVLGGALRSGYEHWEKRGRREGQRTKRSPEWPADWDEGRYLRLNPDVRDAIRAGSFGCGYEHWRARGQYESRPGGPGLYGRTSAADALRNYPPGVNSFGYYAANTGQSYAARGYLGEFRELLPTTALDIPWAEERPGGVGECLTSLPYAFNMVNINPDRLREFFRLYGPAALPGRYNIGAWVWELPAAYPEWRSFSRVFQEIWVPTRFVESALQAVSAAPLFTVPYTVDELPDRSDIDRRSFGWAQDQFVFLYVFDLASTLRRKNPLALVRSFQRAFSRNENVLLVLKYQHRERNPQAAGLLENAVRGVEKVQLISTSFSDEHIHGLHRSCDCFVSPHRGEGFGLNIAEAMYYGKPVIATGYSGNMDYTNQQNSFLIDFDLAPIGQSIGYYRANYFWADVCEGHLAHLLRLVYTNREEAARRGAMGQRTVREMFSRTRVRRLMRERVVRWMGPDKEHDRE